MTVTNSWQILSWSWRASPSLERMDCQVLKQNMHIMGRFTLTAGAVGVGVDDGEEEVGDGASPCLSSLSLSWLPLDLWWCFCFWIFTNENCWKTISLPFLFAIFWPWIILWRVDCLWNLIIGIAFHRGGSCIQNTKYPTDIWEEPLVGGVRKLRKYV